ncbi:MAG: hypothetical protein U0R19_19495 [Bryobacteraceae bacterium]
MRISGIGRIVVMACGFAVLGQGQSVSRVWVIPETPVRGQAMQFVVTGEFDAKTVVATLYGPGDCAKGCALSINGEKKPNVFSGTARMEVRGKYEIEVRNGDGPAGKRVPFCTVVGPSITQVWTKPDPPKPGEGFVIGIVGAGFDAASAGAVACWQQRCSDLALASRSFGFLTATGPALPGGKYKIGVRNKGDKEAAFADLVIAPSLDEISTVPAVVKANVAFQASIIGKGFMAGETRIKVSHPKYCPKECKPNGKAIKLSETRMDVQMWFAAPGRYQLWVESDGVASNRVELEVK